MVYGHNVETNKDKHVEEDDDRVDSEAVTFVDSEHKASSVLASARNLSRDYNVLDFVEPNHVPNEASDDECSIFSIPIIEQENDNAISIGRCYRWRFRCITF